MILGLHHVTAIAADGPANVRFYRDVLGLRLVKRTVNFDDPTSWHLYFGDATGSPGSLATFFIVPGLPRGRVGWPQVGGIVYAIGWGTAGSLRQSIRDQGQTGNMTILLPPDDGARLEVEGPEGLFFEALEPDSDGVSDKSALVKPRPQISRLATPMLLVERAEPTIDFLTEVLGMTVAAQGPSIGTRLSLLRDPTFTLDVMTAAVPGRPGAGTVHHVAFRVATDADQLALRERLLSAGVNVSPVVDRTYFKSLYFREPGGILLEIATDGPGFAVDEPADSLGETLSLPPELESRRAEIEAGLPPLG